MLIKGHGSHDGSGDPPQMAVGRAPPRPRWRDRRDAGLEARGTHHALSRAGRASEGPLRPERASAVAPRLLEGPAEAAIHRRAPRPRPRPIGPVSLYVDTSCLLKLFFDEPETERTIE